MARAKRTDRNEARRKYRAYLQAQAEAEAAANEPEEEPAPAPRPSLFGRRPSPAPKPAATARPKSATATAAAATPTPGVGMNFFKAMGAAYRPVHYRDDLRYLPTMLTKTIGVWVGVGLAIIATVIVFVDSSRDILIGLASLCVGPMPLGAVMLAGVLTVRGAWMAGLITGGVGGLCGGIIMLARPERWFDATLGPIPSGLDSLAIQSVMAGLAFGALFGAASAWYRRFLTLAMPPNPSRGGQSKRRNARPTAKKTAKPSR